MQTMKWEGDRLFILDQTKLPGRQEYIECDKYQRVTEAICRLEVRGAPAIGAAAAFALVLAARQFAQENTENFWRKIQIAKEELAASRPTAVNLCWALERLWSLINSKDIQPVCVAALLEEEASRIYQEDIDANKSIGRYGAALLPGKGAVLTHCNAGALATCGWGTALGVIREAFSQNKVTMVFADETRPLLQGARITAMELMQDKIPVTLITDSMAGWAMKKGLIQSVVTGADRIALNGDSANKIGTYALAVLAREHGIPFYIAAPVSTIDFSIVNGDAIPIEQRAPAEVACFCGLETAPQGVTVYNPAFDVTPHEFITAIITEQGVLQKPFKKSIAQLKEKISLQGEKT